VPTGVQGLDTAQLAPISDPNGGDALARNGTISSCGTPIVSSTPGEEWSSPMTPPACGTALGVPS